MMKLFVWVAAVATFHVINVMADDWTYTCFDKGPDVISDNSSTTIKCSASGADEDQAKAASFCHRPDNKQANNTFLDYGCGKCPAAAKNGTCLSCPAWNTTSNGENSNCNKHQAPIFTFSCYQGGASVKCSNGSLLKDIHCWGPKPTYKENNANLTECGCGTCEAALSADPNAGWKLDDCKVCDFENCNGAAVMMSVLASVVAIFWLYV